MSWKGGRVPPPARNWIETGLPSEILKAVERVGYVKPSPIQMAAIPVALQGRDLIGVAETGDCCDCFAGRPPRCPSFAPSSFHLSCSCSLSSSLSLSGGW
jgi:hypothetical protein